MNKELENFREALIALGKGSQIPESLLSGKGMEYLIQRVGDLPSAAASVCAFELRLNDAKPSADFAVFLVPGPVTKYYIDAGLGANSFPYQVWLSQYLSSRSVRDEWVHSVVLAYDIIGSPIDRPEPPIVYLKRDPLADQLSCSAHTVEQFVDTIERITLWNCNDSIIFTLKRVNQMLPEGAGVVIVAPITRAVTKQMVRLAIAGISTPQLEAFLSRIEWQGEIQTVIRKLIELDNVADKFILILDVNKEGIVPQLGFEMFPKAYKSSNSVELLKAWEATTSDDWRLFINSLTDMGLCLRSKAEGLLSWPRYEYLYDNNDVFRFYVGINHVKITFRKQSLQAKAYVGIKLMPLNSASL